MTDLAWALDNIKRVNEIVAKNPELREILVSGKYNFLQLYQPLIFLDLRGYYREKTSKEKGASGKNFSVGVLISAAGILVVSFACLLSLFLNRKKIAVFSSDKTNSFYGGDFRIQGIYDHLSKNKIGFVEFFHTVIGLDFFKNLMRRKRLAFYVESIDILFVLSKKIGLVRSIDFEFPRVDLDTLSSDRDFIREIICKYVFLTQKTQFKIFFLEKIFSCTSIKTLLAIDSTRRYGELVAACNSVGISTYAFQHGQFTKYQVGWLAASDVRSNIVRPKRLFVWSDYWIKELRHLGSYFTDEELSVGGNPKGNETQMSLQIDRLAPEDKTIKILIPFETDGPKNNIRNVVAEILRCPLISIYFKVRPDLDLDFQKNSYGFEGENDRVIVVEDVRNCVDKIDMAIGIQSTLLYEMIYFLKPVLVIKNDLDYMDGMIRNNLADTIDIKNINNYEFLLKIKNLPMETLVERKNILYGKNMVKISDTLEGIL